MAHKEMFEFHNVKSIFIHYRIIPLASFLMYFFEKIHEIFTSSTLPCIELNEQITYLYMFPNTPDTDMYSIVISKGDI